MNTQILFRISKMTLLVYAVSLVALVLVYAIQHPQLLANLATVSWNGVALP